MQAVIVYTTCISETEAARIGRTIVAEHLAACANIIENMRSIYHWKGVLEDGTETILLLKTQSGLAQAVMRRIKELHSFDVPCIITLPSLSAEPTYLDWLAGETSGGQG